MGRSGRTIALSAVVFARRSGFVAPADLADDPTCSDRDAVWAEYIFRIARNDLAALSALCCEARPIVFGRALRIVGYPADADEIAADVFTKIWSRGDTYEPSRGSATGWILTIARNLACEKLRKRAQEMHMAYGVECTVVHQDRYLSMTGTNNNLYEALALLPVNQRRAIELAFLSELSHAEIAQRLSEPLGTIKTRIRLGLDRLRRALV